MTSPVTYYPDFLDQSTEGVWFDRLWNELDWERRPDAPRREYWTCGEPGKQSYTYGRGKGVRTYYPRPEHEMTKYGRGRLFETTSTFFHGCFLNGYEDERDSLGWHSDDDPGIDHTKGIAVITLGSGRAIQFMPIGGDKSSVEELFLEPGSMLLMHPGMQQTHLHRIPKVGRKTGARISMTYRALNA